MEPGLCPCGCGKHDHCAPECQTPRVRWVCKRNGEMVKHAECERSGPHAREEWAPKCSYHGMALVRG